MFGIEIDEERCTQCGRCVDACPIPCFTFNEEETKVLVTTEEDCLVCRNCQEECPKNCIEIHSSYQSTVNYF